MSQPRWLPVALGELGVTEAPGPADNPRILEYHAVTTYKATDDEVPWCSAFVCWVMEQAGFRHPASARARAWLNTATAIEAQRLEGGLWVPTAGVGSVVVLERPPDPMSGHVGLLMGWSASRVWVLGGNQGDRVSIVSFDRRRVLGYRMPVGA